MIPTDWSDESIVARLREVLSELDKKEFEQKALDEQQSALFNEIVALESTVIELTRKLVGHVSSR